MTDTVLIIAGDSSLRWELHSALTGAEYTVLEVAEWTPKLAEFKPDIAIVDEVLPSGDGKDVCSQLHNSFGIPVILLGKDSSGEAWMAAVEAGADFYFTKPASHQEVVARVKAILRRYKEDIKEVRPITKDDRERPVDARERPTDIKINKKE